MRNCAFYHFCYSHHIIIYEQEYIYSMLGFHSKDWKFKRDRENQFVRIIQYAWCYPDQKIFRSPTKPICCNEEFWRDIWSEERSAVVMDSHNLYLSDHFVDFGNCCSIYQPKFSWYNWTRFTTAKAWKLTGDLKALKNYFPKFRAHRSHRSSDGVWVELFT